jgi:hypothetical protein
MTNLLQTAEEEEHEEVQAVTSSPYFTLSGASMADDRYSLLDVKSNQIAFVTYTWLADVNASVAKCLCF